eukprot:3884264-Rhodomonas_salina.4
MEFAAFLVHSVLTKQLIRPRPRGTASPLRMTSFPMKNAARIIRYHIAEKRTGSYPSTRNLIGSCASAVPHIALHALLSQYWTSHRSISYRSTGRRIETYAISVPQIA